MCRKHTRYNTNSGDFLIIRIKDSLLNIVGSDSGKMILVQSEVCKIYSRFVSKGVIVSRNLLLIFHICWQSFIATNPTSCRNNQKQCSRNV